MWCSVWYIIRTLTGALFYVTMVKIGICPRIFICMVFSLVNTNFGNKLVMLLCIIGCQVDSKVLCHLIDVTCGLVNINSQSW